MPRKPSEVCIGCGKPKSPETFGSYLEKRGRDAGKRKLCGRCRECQAAYKREYNARNPEQRRIAAAADYQRAKERNPLLNRVRELRRCYGLTPEDYDWLLWKQGGGCAVCGEDPPDGEWLHVDHCHRSGVIRGLLCASCNRALGVVDDSIERLNDLRFYLKDPPVQIDLPRDSRAWREWVRHSVEE